MEKQELMSRRTFLELGTGFVGGVLLIDGAQRFVGHVGFVDSIIPPTEVSQKISRESALDSDTRRVAGFCESWFGSNALKLSSSEVLYRFIDQIINKK